MNINSNTKKNEANQQHTNNQFITFLYNIVKICKHEFLMSRILVVISLIIALCIVLLALSSNGKMLYYSSIIIFTSFAFLIFGISYFLSIAMSFYHGIFGKYAYLTHSLPITLDSILFAKIFVFMLWSLVLIAESCALGFVLYNSVEYFKILKINISDILFAICNWFSWTLFEITYIFMITALVHRKKSFLFLHGIIIYFAIKILLSIILIIFIDKTNIDITRNIYIIMPLVCSIVWYMVCKYILVYKLNL